MIVRLCRIASKQDLRRAFAIRKRVFVREQRVPQAIELDRHDAQAIHFLAFAGKEAVGTARVVIHQRSAKIGRMAVLKSYRKKGIGKRLLHRAVAAALQQGARKIYLHAQVPVIGFYEKMDFRCAGAVFNEAGIPHRKMIWTGRRAQALKRMRRTIRPLSRAKI